MTDILERPVTDQTLERPAAGKAPTGRKARPAKEKARPAREKAPAGKESDNPLASVSKALMLLESLKQASGPVGVSGLARSAGMAKSTAFRLLAHLEESGFVERAGTSYVLGWRLFELGNNVAPCRPHGLRSIAVPHLTDLQARTGMAVHLGVLQGAEVVLLEKVHGVRTVTMPSRVGSRVPSSCTALGKAMLAYLPADELRQAVTESSDEQGLTGLTRFSLRQPGRLLDQLREIRAGKIAHEREEALVGLVAVAAPILVDGRAVASISLSSATGQVTAEAYARLVQQTAAAIAQELAGRH
ncbi:IclR family transcriptional regulator [Granulicoccus phenolivorans]|uniref:IclR family transcriptional regulator n=1 Tax=Granulicoccus phenolivorans TaxID=266854 RepID=UPI0003FAFCDE|nr:IclR family transcriptional regulator [Granulicoccus phenolivorans]